MIRRWLKARRQRLPHDDRDPFCMWFWGDRSGYPLTGPHAPQCTICNPNREGILP